MFYNGGVGRRVARPKYIKRMVDHFIWLQDDDGTRTFRGHYKDEWEEKGVNHIN